MAASSRSASSRAARAAPASRPSRPETSAAAASASCLRASVAATDCRAASSACGRDRQLAGRLVAPLLGLGQPRRGLVGRRPQLEQALRPRAAALGPVRPEQVTGPGHGLKTRIFPNDQACLAQVSGHHHVAQKLRRGLRQPVRVRAPDRRRGAAQSPEGRMGRKGRLGLRGRGWGGGVGAGGVGSEAAAGRGGGDGVSAAMTRAARPASSRRRVARISAAASRPATATASAAAPRAAAMATSYPSATRRPRGERADHAAEPGRVGEHGRGGVRAAPRGFGQRLGTRPPGGQLAG